MMRRVVTVAAMLVFAATAIPMQPVARAGAGSTQLTFTVWTFAIDTIKDNINRFQTRVPNVTVNLTDYNWGQYNDTIVANFVGGSTVPDILYSSDHWLQQWAAAGWIAPLDDYFPQARELAKSFAPYAVEGMTYKGKLYGFPYYADPMAFMYNAAVLRQAGFGAPPQTWAEVLEQAKAIKAKGLVQYPIGFGFSLEEPFSIETVISMVYSEGGNLFDKDLNPAFDRAGSAMVKTIEWVREALRAGVMNPESLQWDGVQAGNAMKGGTQVFFITRASGLWNSTTRSSASRPATSSWPSCPVRRTRPSDLYDSTPCPATFRVEARRRWTRPGSSSTTSADLGPITIIRWCAGGRWTLGWGSRSCRSSKTKTFAPPSADG